MRISTSATNACKRLSAIFYINNRHTTCATETNIFYGAGVVAPGHNNTPSDTRTFTSSDDHVPMGSFLFSSDAIRIIINFIRENKEVRIYLFIAITLLPNFLFTQNTYAGVTGPGTAWQYVRKIALNTATPLTNFQVKVTLTTALLGNPYTNIKPDGSDLRFYDINNNSCNYWIEGTFTNSGNSTIWVNIPTTGSTAVFMYYGNAAATAVSSGTNTFDFFDDFLGTTLAGNWTSRTVNGTVSVSGGVVTISNTNGGNNTTGGAGISSAFTAASTSFILESKHTEPAYYRNRFYVANSSFPTNPVGFDYGYFYSGGAGAQTTATVFWNTYIGQATVNRNTDYLTQWQITNGTSYIWNTYTYANNALVQTNNTTYASAATNITIWITEQLGTSTIVDWVRVRKSVPGFADLTATVGAQLTNITAGITAQTNVLCNGLSTGSATVTATGGGTPYTYSWNSSPIQTTQTAANLPAGTYTVTVTDNNGISATSTATITQPTAVVASVNGQTNVTCNGGANGTITIAASGGSGTGYSFSVDNGNTWAGPFTSPYTYPNLSASVAYKIRVKDNLGCTSKTVQ